MKKYDNFYEMDYLVKLVEDPELQDRMQETMYKLSMDFYADDLEALGIHFVCAEDPYYH